MKMNYEKLTPAQKRVRNILAKDPDHFRKAGSKGGKKSAELGGGEILNYLLANKLFIDYKKEGKIR